MYSRRSGVLALCRSRSRRCSGVIGVRGLGFGGCGVAFLRCLLGMGFLGGFRGDFLVLGCFGAFRGGKSKTSTMLIRYLLAGTIPWASEKRRAMGCRLDVNY